MAPIRHADSADLGVTPLTVIAALLSLLSPTSVSNNNLGKTAWIFGIMDKFSRVVPIHGTLQRAEERPPLSDNLLDYCTVYPLYNNYWIT